MPFQIWPSEALRIGSILEEYLQCVADTDGSVRFIPFLNERLAPFVPSFDRWRKVDEKMVFDFSRRSLLDLLIDQVRSHVELDEFEQVVFARSEPEFFQAMAVVSRLSEQLELGITDDTIEPRNDDAGSIEKELLLIATTSDVLDSLRIGRYIGKVFADCWRFEKSFVDEDVFSEYFEEERCPSWNAIEIDEFVVSIASHINALLDCCGKSLPQSISDGLRFFAGQNQLASQAPARTLRVLHHIRDMASSVAGAMTLSLRDADTRAATIDNASHTPRLFRLTTDSSSDRVGGQLLAMQELLSHPKPPLTPEGSIAMLTNGIEALVKAAWPEDFADSRADVVNVIIAKSKAGRLAEQRCAGLALGLFRQYRNQATHALNQLDCTWDEVNHLRYGLSALRTHVNKVKAARSKEVEKRISN